MIQFVAATPSPSTPFSMDCTEPSLVSASTSRTSSWSIETDPQLFTPDANFWQDMSTYVCASPNSAYEYAQDEPSVSPDDSIFKVASRGTSKRVRSKEQSPEVILRRRAQNRASQRAYRDRKDRRVKELETQLEEMSEQVDVLRKERDDFCSAHEKLKGEQIKWLEERQGRDRELHDETRWRTETCVSPVALANGKDMERGLMVKVMICKRCFNSAGDSSASGCDG